MHVFGLPMALTILHSYKCDILFVEKLFALKGILLLYRTSLASSLYNWQ